jgi:hypothetical protein
VLMPPAPPPASATFDEDPYMYAVERGSLHMMTRRQPLGQSCPLAGPEPSDCRCGGSHMFAEDAAGPWFVDPRHVFNFTLEVALLMTVAYAYPVSQYQCSVTLAQSLNCS